MSFIDDIKNVDYNRLIKSKYPDSNKKEQQYLSKIQPESHMSKDTFKELAIYPEHIPRKTANDKNFNKVRELMIDKADMPCFICNVSKSKIKSKELSEDNFPFEMELHHFFIEWSFAEGVDLTKWHDKMVPMICKFNYLEYYFDNLKTERQMEKIIKLVENYNPEVAEILREKDLNKKLELKRKYLTFESNDQLIEWAQNDIFNMMPLCSFHHRKAEIGIHNKSYPLWISTLILKEDLLKATQKIIELDDLLRNSEK